MAEYRMPSLGADMEEGTIVEWCIKPGDRVQRGDIVAIIDTEKSTIEAEIFDEGVVEEILVPEGHKVPVGTPLARIGAAPAGVAAHPETGRPRALEPQPPTVATAAPPPSARPSPVLQPPPASRAELVLSPVVRHLAEKRSVDLSAVHGTGAGGSITRHDVERAASEAARPQTEHVRASPLARKRAAELGVPLHEVAATGPGGAVSAADVEGARPVGASREVTAGGPSLPEAGETTEATRALLPVERQAAMRHAIAVLMARSNREIPHYYLSTTIDMSRAVEWLHEANLERSVSDRLVPSTLLLKATALSAKAVPETNGIWVDDEFRPSPAVHLGVAVSLRQGGLVAPAIHDADRLSLDELMGRLRDLVTRARAGVLRSSEMSDPTITVTNLGDQGVEAVFGVIYPPQVALVGFGKVVERPWAHEGMLGVRPVVEATLAADHRVSDGHRGARFLAIADSLLQEPEKL